MNRRAFTVLELLVVIAVITVLISLTMFGMSQLKQQAKRTETIRRLGAIGHALTEYLATWPQFGEATTAGVANLSDPYAFLGRRRILSGRTAFVDPSQRYLTRFENGEWVYCPAREATDIADGWGYTSVFRFQVTTAIDGTRPYTTRIVVRSQSGTLDPDPLPLEDPQRVLSDDLAIDLDVERGSFEHRRIRGVAPDGTWTFVK